ncbi:MAG: dihydroorotate dehydrogenase [Armatimonadota bacterium]
MTASEPDMQVRIANLVLQNPVITASGTFGYGLEFEEFMDLSSLGAVTIKSVSLEPRQGNRPPRIVETASGMLNAIGLQNPGVQVIIDEKLPELAAHGVPVIVNLVGESIDEYVELAQQLSKCADVSALELNISCPNVGHGMYFSSSADLTAQLVSAVREVTDLPLITKLSPNVTDIAEIAVAAQDAGSDALSLINTLVGMSIDTETRCPHLGNITGGLSGPAIKPVAVRCVWEVYEAVEVPLIGMGGIMCTDDAVEFMLAGATAIAVGTANFVNPTTSADIVEGLHSYAADRGLSRITDLTGAAH